MFNTYGTDTNTHISTRTHTCYNVHTANCGLFSRRGCYPNCVCVCMQSCFEAQNFECNECGFQVSQTVANTALEAICSK